MGLYYGSGHAWNTTCPADTRIQNAQRAEVRVATSWAAWAGTGPTELWTDSALVVRGFENLEKTGEHGMKENTDLWNRIREAWHTLGRGEAPSSKKGERAQDRGRVRR